jgi:hypothetical protein
MIIIVEYSKEKDEVGEINRSLEPSDEPTQVRSK